MTTASNVTISTPTAPDDVATKAYVDSQVAGVTAITSDTNIMFGTGEACTTLQAAVDSLNANIIGNNVTVSLKMNAEVLSINAAQLAIIDSHFGGQMELTGATPLSKTISSVVSVTGFSGAWDVTYTLNSGTGVVAGQVLNIRNTERWSIEPGIVSGQAPDGEAVLPYYKVGDVSSLGTTVTFGGTNATGAQATYIRNSSADLLHVSGETKTITNNNAGTNQITVNSAFATDITTGEQYFFVSKANTGTIGTSGLSTTVTGSSTAFLTEGNKGCMLVCADSDGKTAPRKITAIANNGSMTVDPAVNITAGTKYSIIVPRMVHEGCWEVLSVAGNNVTVKNTCHYDIPINKVVSGEVTVFPSVLKNTSSTGKGLVVNSKFRVKDIGLVGVSTSSSYAGIECSGHVVLENCGISGFGRSLNQMKSGVIDWPNAVFSSAANFGFNSNDGGSLYLNHGIVSGCGAYGGFIGSGVNCRFSGGRAVGNATFGIRQEVGSSMYADFPAIMCNGSSGHYLVNDGGAQGVGGRFWLNGGSGVHNTNEAGGRWSGSTFWCNGAKGYHGYGTTAELNYCWAAGNVGQGYLVEKGEINAVGLVSSSNGTAFEAPLQGKGNLTGERLYGTVIGQTATYGTWTPTIEGATTAGAATYSVQQGTWTREGNRVILDLVVTLSSFTGTGQIRIKGLPFTPVNSVAFQGSIGATGMVGFTESVTAFAQTSGANTYLVLAHGTTSSTFGSALTAAEITPASSSFRGQIMILV